MLVIVGLVIALSAFAWWRTSIAHFQHEKSLRSLASKVEVDYAHSQKSNEKCSYANFLVSLYASLKDSAASSKWKSLSANHCDKP